MILKYSEDFIDIAFALKKFIKNTVIEKIPSGIELINENESGETYEGLENVVDFILKSEKYSYKDFKRTRFSIENIDNLFLSYVSLFNTLKDLIIKPNLKNIKYVEEMVQKYKCQEYLFFLLKIQVGKIINIENVEGSDNLYVEEVDFGFKTQIVSGLRTYYKKDQLLNKKCLFITNIKKSKIKGLESNGMILCGKNDDKLEVLFVDDSIEVGTIGFIPDCDFFKNLSAGTIDLKKSFFRDLFGKLCIKEGFVCYNDLKILFSGENIKSSCFKGTIG